jgi:glucose 1-dehydrogenase
MRLGGKVALISGGSHGIGKAIALAFASAGADVVLTYREREKGARETAKLIEAKGRRAHVLHADVTQPETCKEIVEESVRTFGHIDVLVNNAGGSRKGELSILPLEHWRYTFDLCVTSAFLTSQALARHLISRGAGGSIINISSVHSTHVWPNSASYGAAKAALNRLTMSMAVEWARLGIRANAIAPGYVNTAETDEEKERYARNDNTSAPLITAQRTAKPSEIAEVAIFLASDEASYVSGQTIFADGGLLLPPITTADFMRGDRTPRSFVG